MNKANPRPLCEHRTYDPWDPSSTGWDITIYEDHAILVRHTSTPGDRLGRTLRASVPGYVYDAIGRKLTGTATGPTDLESAVRNWIDYVLGPSGPEVLKEGRKL